MPAASAKSFLVAGAAAAMERRTCQQSIVDEAAHPQRKGGSACLALHHHAVGLWDNLRADRREAVQSVRINHRRSSSPATV
jgi:hypothetical protein